MSLWGARKPRPFHHEMIYQGRTRHTQDVGGRLRFSGRQQPRKTKPVVSWVWIGLTILLLLLVFLLYM